MPAQAGQSNTFTREELESDVAFIAAEEVLEGEFGPPDREEDHSDIYGAIINAVLEELRKGSS